MAPTDRDRSDDDQRQNEPVPYLPPSDDGSDWPRPKPYSPPPGVFPPAPDDKDSVFPPVGDDDDDCERE